MTTNPSSIWVGSFYGKSDHVSGCFASLHNHICSVTLLDLIGYFIQADTSNQVNTTVSYLQRWRSASALIVAEYSTCSLCWRTAASYQGICTYSYLLCICCDKVTQRDRIYHRLKAQTETERQAEAGWDKKDWLIEKPDSEEEKERSWWWPSWTYSIVHWMLVRKICVALA